MCVCKVLCKPDNSIDHECVHYDYSRVAINCCNKQEPDSHATSRRVSANHISHHAVGLSVGLLIVHKNVYLDLHLLQEPQTDLHD